MYMSSFKRKSEHLIIILFYTLKSVVHQKEIFEAIMDDIKIH